MKTDWRRAFALPQGRDEKEKHASPARSKLTVLRQLCNLIPPHLVSQLACQTGADELARTFSNWSHVVALIFAQLVHAIGLNDVCDGLRLHSGQLSVVRGATPPSKNGLSHANKERPAEMAEALFWQTLDHLKGLCAVFAGRHGRRVAGRFSRTIHVVDCPPTSDVVRRRLEIKRQRRHFVALRGYLSRFSEAVTHGAGPCRAERLLCNIDTQGDVTFCIDRLENSVGNILRDAMPDLVRRLRQQNRANTCRDCWTSCRSSIETIRSARKLVGNLWDYWQMARPVWLGGWF